MFCFQKVAAAKESSRRGGDGWGAWAVVLPVQSPAWPWGDALSHLCTSCSLNPRSLKQPDWYFVNCPQILSLPCLKPFSGALYFFKIKPYVESTTLPHSTLLQLQGPFSTPAQTVQAPFCLRTFAHFYSPCLTRSLSLSPSSCRLFSAPWLSAQISSP